MSYMLNHQKRWVTTLKCTRCDWKYSENSRKCNVEFEFGHTILPNYDVPQEFATHYDYLEKLTYDGLKIDMEKT